MFQTPLVHAPIGNWAAAGGWRFLIFNNKAILDSPGESVCIEKQGGQVEVSYIPLDEESEEVPVLAQLENIIKIAKSRHVHFQGIKMVVNIDGFNQRIKPEKFPSFQVLHKSY